MGNDLSTFSGCLSYAVEGCPHRCAITVGGGGRTLYADLDEYVDKLASWLLSHGVQPHDAVAIVFSDNVESVVSLLAAMRTRAVAVLLLQPACTEGSLKRYLDKHKVKVLLHGPEADPTARAVAEELDVEYCLVDLRSLPSSEANARGITSEPGDMAILLPAPPDDTYIKTQWELASLVMSADQLSTLVPADPLLLHLRGHRHLASMFSLLAKNVKSLTTKDGKVKEYGLKLPELNLAFAVPVLLAFIVNYLQVEPWAKTTAPFLVYLGLHLGIIGVLFNLRLKYQCGRWLGAAGLSLVMAGMATVVLPALGWRKAVVAGVVTVVSAVAGMISLIRSAPPLRHLPSIKEDETGRVVAPRVAAPPVLAASPPDDEGKLQIVCVRDPRKDDPT